MSKSQNRGMGNRKMQGNGTPQKVKNHTIAYVMNSEGNETSV
jgi:hypothetical protein